MSAKRCAAKTSDDVAPTGLGSRGRVSFYIHAAPSGVSLCPEAPAPGRKIVAALKRAGFVVLRIRGSHHFLRHADGRATVVPCHAGETIGLDLRKSVQSAEKRLRPAEWIVIDTMRLCQPHSSHSSIGARSSSRLSRHPTADEPQSRKDTARRSRNQRGQGRLTSYLLHRFHFTADTPQRRVRRLALGAGEPGGGQP